jgi:uncharacterized membrane protein YedE/YeeE
MRRLRPRLTPLARLPPSPPRFPQALAALLPQLTVGLVATFITVACIIAADTGAYFVGKNLGRTKLTDISPKKTVEGALGGLASAVAAALALRWLFNWPGDALAAAGYGVLMFVSSIFGDLIESIMKREAGLKVRAPRMRRPHGGRAAWEPGRAAAEGVHAWRRRRRRAGAWARGGPACG